MVKIRRTALLVVTLTVVAQAGFAEQRDGTIRGRVLDGQAGAITGSSVVITCRDQRRRTITDSNGAFLVSGLPVGRCTVTALSPLFESEAVEAEATPEGTDVSVVLRIRRFTAEVVVTPARGLQETVFDLPEPTSVTSRRDIDSRPYQLLAQVLREEPGVLLQQTTSAQVSPIIRGFTGQSNVYLVDGVRLNNGSWRSGPSQYVGWLEEAAVDRIEVIRGSGSVQYGSDALGGTIQFLTAPSVLDASGLRFDGGAEIMTGSADRSVGGAGEIAVTARSASIRIGGSTRRIEDLRGGRGKDSHAAVTRFLGLPSSVLGSRMRATSFDQGGAYGVGMVEAGRGATVRGVYMHENQTGARRYDRVLGGEGLYDSGFEPQTLDFALVRYERSMTRVLDGVSGTFFVNRQADGRYEQARPSAVLDTQTGTTTAIGYQLQAHRQMGRHQLVIGGEFYDESIGAARKLIQPTGVAADARPDIPDGTTYSNLGLFAQNMIQLGNRVSVRGGLRYSHFGFATTADPVLGVIAEKVVQHSVTFQTATVVNLTKAVNATFNVSRGFRAANAADLGSIGLSGGGGFEINPSKAHELGAFVGTTGAANAVSTGTPVTGLSPEVVYQYEAGLKARAGRFSASANVFDMEFFDSVQRRALVFTQSVIGTTISGFQIVRQDAAGLAYIAQDIRPIATKANVDRARILGFDVTGDMSLTSAWTAGGYFSMSNGRIPSTGEYVRRMPPPMGGARVRWSGSRLWAEGVLTFAAEQTRLNAGDLTDARIGAVRTRASIATFFNGTATDLGLVRNGMLVQTSETLAEVQNRVLGTAASAPMFTSQPGFAAFGLRGGVRVTPRLDVIAIGENLTDRNYRLYGSGLDAPGVNAQLRIRYRF